MKKCDSSKVVIVGTGDVGASFAYALLQSGKADSAAVKSNDYFILPLIYGCGTAMPVILFAFLIAFGGEYLGKAFNCLTRLELWFRYTAGVLFILAGIYYSLTHIYGLSFW